MGEFSPIHWLFVIFICVVMYGAYRLFRAVIRRLERR